MKTFPVASLLLAGLSMLVLSPVALAESAPHEAAAGPVAVSSPSSPTSLETATATKPEPLTLVPSTTPLEAVEPATSPVAPAAFSTSGVGSGLGTIILESDTWDSICKVEIVKGMNAPDRGARSSYNNVKKGRTFSASNRICYRRSGRPRDCGSSMTSWTCCSHLISGSDTCSLN